MKRGRAFPSSSSTASDRSYRQRSSHRGRSEMRKLQVTEAKPSAIIPNHVFETNRTLKVLLKNLAWRTPLGLRRPVQDCNKSLIVSRQAPDGNGFFMLCSRFLHELKRQFPAPPYVNGNVGILEQRMHSFFQIKSSNVLTGSVATLNLSGTFPPSFICSIRKCAMS